MTVLNNAQGLVVYDTPVVTGIGGVVVYGTVIASSGGGGGGGTGLQVHHDFPSQLQRAFPVTFSRTFPIP